MIDLLTIYLNDNCIYDFDAEKENLKNQIYALRIRLGYKGK